MGSERKAPSWQVNQGPMAIFTPCSNSHPFEERKIPITRSEDQAIKVGRAVVRLQPAVNNAIFDCKVLSRNHAVMWYEDEQFLIKDTRSSNGTFVNNDRLSNSGEESVPRALRSGDILQLGVEIVDNTKKVASGCVTCIVRLINERGEECLNIRSNSLIPIPTGRSDLIPLKYTLIRNDKLFIMDQYVKEARFRENLLGQKLQSLEEQLAQAQEALQTSWQALINEEQLLSRIEMLESQLAIMSSKNTNSEEIRKEIQEIYEDRAKAELVSKDSLRKAEEQVFETSMRLHDAENGLVNIEEENQFLRFRCQQYEEEFTKHRSEYDELQSKFNEAMFNSKLAPAINEQHPKNENKSPTVTIPNSTVTEFKVSKVKEEPGTVGQQSEIKDVVDIVDSCSVDLELKDHTKQKLVFDLLNLLKENCVDSTKLQEGIKELITNAELPLPEISAVKIDDELNEEDLPMEPIEPNVSFIGESLEANKVCTCGRHFNHQTVTRSNNDTQVFLLSTFPLAILLALIFFPIIALWPSQESSNNKGMIEKKQETDSPTNSLANGSSS